MFDRQSTLDSISDLSKDVYGFRMRKDYEGMSDEALEAEWNYLVAELEVVMAREREAETVSRANWKLAIDKIMEAGAPDRATAIRWDMLAQNCHSVDEYCFHSGLSYEMEAGIEAMLRAKS